MYILTEAKNEKHIKEERPEIVFKTAVELKDYLNNAIISDVRIADGEFQSWTEQVAGFFEFQWGGSTMLFTKRNFGIRIQVASIKSMYKVKVRNCIFIETKKGNLLEIVCERKK